MSNCSKWCESVYFARDCLLNTGRVQTTPIPTMPTIIMFNLHLCFYCRLADLVGLTKLVIGGNLFRKGKLPGVVYELKNLRELFLAGSGLVEIDERYGTDHQRTYALY